MTADIVCMEATLRQANASLRGRPSRLRWTGEPAVSNCGRVVGDPSRPFLSVFITYLRACTTELLRLKSPTSCGLVLELSVSCVCRFIAPRPGLTHDSDEYHLPFPYVGRDFGIEMPDADVVAGDDWVETMMAKDFTLKSFEIRQMSVVELGNAAVVKFERLQESTYKGVFDSGEFLVVDVWKKNGDSWTLTNRYAAKVSSKPALFNHSGKP